MRNQPFGLDQRVAGLQVGRERILALTEIPLVSRGRPRGERGERGRGIGRWRVARSAAIGH